MIFEKLDFLKKEVSHQINEKWTFGGFDRSILHSLSGLIDQDMSRGPKKFKKSPKMTANRILLGKMCFTEKRNWLPNV